MKAKLVVIALVICWCASIPGVSQTVAITARKTVHRRPKPQYDFKRTFTIRRPIARAATPALSRKITAAISPEMVLGFKLRDELTEYQWLEEADYKVLFNRDGLLVVEQWMTGTGAYPDSVTKRVVVDASTGNVVRIPGVFRDLPALAAIVKKAQAGEVTEASAEMKSDPDARPEELFRETDFTVKDFGDFSVDAAGVTFYYDYGFPHVIEALQPAGEYRFTWTVLKPFVRRDGLLARFVR